MSKRSNKAPPNPAATAKTPAPAPDPVDVIGQHWADATGLTRKQALEKLAMIGHCTLKANRAGVYAIQKEIEDLAAAKHAAEPGVP